MFCDHILAASFWGGITFLAIDHIFGRSRDHFLANFEGSLFGALKFIPGAVEPAGKALHIYRGPAVRSNCW